MYRIVPFLPVTTRRSPCYDNRMKSVWLRSILVSVLVGLGCARSDPPVSRSDYRSLSDEEIVEIQVRNTLDALQGEEVEKAFFYHTKDFLTERGKDLKSTVETILDLREGGFLDSLNVDYRNLRIDIDGDSAKAEAILLDWSFGSVTFEMEFERRGWLWVVVYSTDF